VEVAERICWSAVREGIGSTEGGARIPVKAVVGPIPLRGAKRSVRENLDHGPVIGGVLNAAHF
jgi:hypothetical protein